MAKRKYSEVEMIGALKQMEAGRSAADVGRELGVSKHTIYAWKAKYGGMAWERRSGCGSSRMRTSTRSAVRIAGYYFGLLATMGIVRCRLPFVRSTVSAIPSTCPASWINDAGMELLRLGFRSR